MNCASHCTISSVNLAFILWLLPMFKFVDLKIWIVWSFCLFVCLYYEGPLLLLLLLLLQFNKESNCWGCHNAATLAAEALAVLRVKTAESQTVAASFSSCFLHLFLNLNCLLTPINIPQVVILSSEAAYHATIISCCSSAKGRRGREVSKWISFWNTKQVTVFTNVRGIFILTPLTFAGISAFF